MATLWIATLLLLGSGAGAATMGEGLAAYQRGDYSSARTIVEPLAQSGDADAQYLLGRMHARGEGVLQDYVIAHQWLNLSAARGSRDARAERDRIARQMTPAQIAEAQQLARAWKPSAASVAARSSSRPVSSRAPSPTRGPNTGNLVKDIQAMLAELGYDPGPADGVMGRRTRSAIRTYQLHSDLSVNGQPSQGLRTALAADLGYVPPDTGSAATVASTSRGSSAASAAAGSSATSSANAGTSSTQQSQSGAPSQAPIYVQEAQRSQGRRASTSADGSTDALADLDKLVQDGVRQRRADRRVLEDLQDLVARYDQPWQRVVVEDTFADGNYTSNPSWQVVSGRFWIGRGEGLRSQVQDERSRQSTNSKEELGLAVLGALLGQNSRQQNASGPATIALPAKIGPLFSIEAELLSGQKPGEFSLGIYRGENAQTSLRLTYLAGQTPSLRLTRHNNGRVRTLASYDRALNLEDGRAHYVVWSRDREGRMRISVDERELMATGPSRRGPPRQGFDGLFATNNSGNYGLRLIRIRSD